MSCLIDTNVLLRSVQPSHSMHSLARQALNELRRRGVPLILVAQNLYEFWVVATRPLADNGLGMSASQTQAEFFELQQFFTILGDIPHVLVEWQSLVTKHAVLGKKAHDARFVAAMKAHGITQLLTFNNSDFARFTGFNLISPHEILATTG